MHSDNEYTGDRTGGVRIHQKRSALVIDQRPDVMRNLLTVCRAAYIEENGCSVKGNANEVRGFCDRRADGKGIGFLVGGQTGAERLIDYFA